MVLFRFKACVDKDHLELEERRLIRELELSAFTIQRVPQITEDILMLDRELLDFSRAHYLRTISRQAYRIFECRQNSNGVLCGYDRYRYQC